MSVPALPYVYCTVADLQKVLSVATQLGQFDDDDSGEPLDSTESGYLDDIIQDATDECNDYLLEKYEAARLATSRRVNTWCTIVAAYLSATRRGNGAPESIQQRYDKAIKEMERVHDGNYRVPGIPTRTTPLPSWSNVGFDGSYRLRKLRVERPISDRHKRPYPVDRDIVADQIVEPN